jgi:hypothetical protein
VFVAIREPAGCAPVGLACAISFSNAAASIVPGTSSEPITKLGVAFTPTWRPSSRLRSRVD